VANVSGKAYALTLFCPIRPGVAVPPDAGLEGQSCAAHIRYALQQLKVGLDSPSSRVPNTYLCRLFVLDDVHFEGHPAVLEHLKSAYLVFEANIYGDRDTWLRGLWASISNEIRGILRNCVGFEGVTDAERFIDYIKKCQVTTTFFFVGSNDLPLAEQLKGLYLKQEFSKFVCANQGKSAAELQAAFRDFVERTKPAELTGPTWKPGVYRLEDVVAE
jgi:hypothetical protein